MRESDGDIVRVRVAGADYVARRHLGDQAVHWLYEPKLLHDVNGAEYWCLNRTVNQVPITYSAGGLSADLNGGRSCPVCNTLAPLPVKGGAS